MKHVILLTVSLLSCAWTNASAVEIEEVTVADSVVVGGEQLVLNGAGIRSKFFFDIYIAALYLPAKTSDVKQAMMGEGNKRIWMHFLYSEVSKEKLVDGWLSGFKHNQSKAQFSLLEKRLGTFNALFDSMKKDEEITFDLLGQETRVFINGEAKGSILGQGFQQALLAVWLGKKPADSSLKKAWLAP